MVKIINKKILNDFEYKILEKDYFITGMITSDDNKNLEIIHGIIYDSNIICVGIFEYRKENDKILVYKGDDILVDSLVRNYLLKELKREGL